MALFKVIIPLRASEPGWQPAQGVRTEDNGEDWPSLTDCLNDLAPHGWSVVSVVAGSIRVGGESMPCPVAFILCSEQAFATSDLERRLKRERADYSRRLAAKPPVKKPGDEIHVKEWEIGAREVQERIQELEERLTLEKARGEGA